MTLHGAFLYARQIVSSAVSVWLIAWGIRRRYELDEELTAREKIIRWAVVLACLAMTFVPGSGLAAVRVIFWLIGLSFVAWPNFARSFVRMFSRNESPSDTQ